MQANAPLIPVKQSLVGLVYCNAGCIGELFIITEYMNIMFFPAAAMLD
jgi:hypothetical protein